MEITAKCPACGKQFHVGEQFAGRRGKCKKCGSIVVIPKIGEQAALAGEQAAGAGQAAAKTSGGKQPAKSAARREEEGPTIGVRRDESDEGAQEEEAESQDLLETMGKLQPLKTIPRKTGEMDAYEVKEEKRRVAVKRSGAYDELIYNQLPIGLIVVGYALPLGLAAWKLLQGPSPGMSTLFLLAPVALLCCVIVPLTLAGIKIAAKVMKFDLVGSPGVKAIAAFAVCPIAVWMLVRSYVGFGNTTGAWGDAISASSIGILLGVAVAFFGIWLLFQLKFVEAAVAWIMAVLGFLAGCGASMAAIFGLVVATHSFLPGLLQKMETQSQDQAAAPSAPAAPAAVYVPTKERAATAKNLAVIGHKLTAYVAAHKQWPASLDALAAEQGMDSGIVNSPFGHASSGPDYVYHTEMQGKDNPPADAIVAYDASEREHDNQMTYALMGDGSVKGIAQDQWNGAMAASDRAINDYKTAVEQRLAREEVEQQRLEKEKEKQEALARLKFGDRPPPVGWKGTPDPSVVTVGLKPKTIFLLPLQSGVLIHSPQVSNCIGELGQHVDINSNVTTYLESWDLKTNKYLGRIVGDPGLHDPVLSSDGELVTGRTSGGGHAVPVYQVWSIHSGKQMQEVVGPAPINCLNPVAVGFLGNDRVITLGDRLQVWDINSGSKVHDMDGSLRRGAGDFVAISPGGKLVAVMDSIERLTLFDAEDGKVLGDAVVPDDPQNPDVVRHDKEALAFSPDGSELALYLGPQSPRVVVWSVRDSSVAADFSLPASMTLAKAHGGAPMSWLPKGNGWLIEDQEIVDRATGAVFTTIADESMPNGSESGPRRVVDDDRILESFTMMAKPPGNMQTGLVPMIQLEPFPLPAEVMAKLRRPSDTASAATHQ